MANASITKNILFIGHVDQGKTTLKKALQTVLDARYGLSNDFGYMIDNCCYRIIDISSDSEILEYIAQHGNEIDVAVFVCSIAGVDNAMDHEQLKLCNKYGIKIACAYMSQVTEDADEFMIDFLDNDIYAFVGSSGHPNTVKLTEEMTTSYSASGSLFEHKNCPILHGDSEKAIIDPFSAYGDVMVRLVHYIKVAIFG